MFRATTRLFCNDIQSQLSLFRKELAVGGPSLAVVSLMKETRTKDQAEQVMTMAQERKIVTKPLYDSYLGCLADLKLTDLVKDGLAKMIESQIIPDDKSYSALLKSHLENGVHFVEIEKLTDKLAKNGAIGNHGYHEVIRFYCRMGLLDVAMRFYNKMVKLHLIPSNAIFNELILAHSKTTQGCKGMFDEMRRRGVEPTEETYEVLAKVYNTDAETCKGLYAGMAKRNILMNANIAGSMINAFGMVKDWGWCKKVWDDLIKTERKPRTETYLAMITYYSQSGDTATMLEVFNALKQTKLVDMQFVNTSLITAHAQMGEYDKSIEIYSTMQKEGSKPAREAYESLMVAYALRKDIKAALSFEKLIKENRVVPNRASMHTLLTCLAHHSDETNVNRILRFMHVEQPPNYDTFVALFKGARGNIGAVLVRRWLREMEEEADIATRESEADALTAYHAALSACARGNDVQGTLQVFNTISAHCAQEISTTTHTQESSTTTYAQAVPAEAYDLVLSTCANAGNLVACKKILEQARKDNIKFQPTTYNKLVEGFGKIGDLPECRKIAEEMREQQMQLDTKARAAIRPLSSGGGLFSTLLDEMEEEE